MSEMLIIAVGQAPSDPLDWARAKDGAILDQGRCENVAALGVILGDHEPTAQTAIIIPGEQAAMRAVAAPPTSQAKFRAAAAFLLEDDLAENLERLHMTTTRKDGVGLVLTSNTDSLNGWINALDDVGVSPDIITPDFAVLPHDEDRAEIVFGEHRVFGAIGHQGFAAERPLADACLEQFVKAEEIVSVNAYGDQNVKLIDFGEKQPDWQHTEGRSPLLYLASQSDVLKAAPNLRCGALRKKKDWIGAAGAWRRAAMIAALCVAALGLNAGAEAMRNTRLANALEEETKVLHVTAFPDQANADPRAHARRMLTSNVGGPAFLALTNQFAASLENANQIQIDRIRYNAARDQFSVNVRFSDINDLEILKNKLSAQGVVTTESSGVRRAGGAYIGELTVSTS